VAAVNRVQWGGPLALTVALSHFPELEVELDLLGSSYNADLTGDQMEALWSRTRQASESLSSRVPSSAACDPLDSDEE
jgi:hypothetical protein